MNDEITYINGHPFAPYVHIDYAPEASRARSLGFLQRMSLRRSVREFSDRVVPRDLIENIILTAASAPSGAHKQPWTFCAVSDPAYKAKIREGAEKEEKVNYESRMDDEWLKDLAPLNLDWNKPFLEEAPWLIVVFKQAYGLSRDGGKKQHYYVNESVGIACGLLLTAIHEAGLVTFTHTPSPMAFLTEILDRPENERPFLLLPVGYPKEDTLVPVLKRKELGEVAKFYEPAVEEKSKEDYSDN